MILSDFSHAMNKMMFVVDDFVAFNEFVNNTVLLFSLTVVFLFKFVLM
jgi:hypothetical protein